MRTVSEGRKMLYCIGINPGDGVIGRVPMITLTQPEFLILWTKTNNLTPPYQKVRGLKIKYRGG
jgi:hypothetical protein